MSQEAVFHAKAVNSEHSEGERVPVAFSGGQKMIFYMTTYNPGGHSVFMQRKQMATPILMLMLYW